MSGQHLQHMTLKAIGDLRTTARTFRATNAPNELGVNAQRTRARISRGSQVNLPAVAIECTLQDRRANTRHVSNTRIGQSAAAEKSIHTRNYFLDPPTVRIG